MRQSAVFLIILLILGVGLHVWKLGSPREVVFDEVHFGKFVTAYCCSGERVFDIHPPHGKLLIAGTAKLLGYSGGPTFEAIGEEFGEVSPIPLRMFSVLMGIALPLIFFGLLLQLGVSRLMAFLGGLLLVFDNALLVQTKFMLLDGLLLVATFGALSVYLLAIKKNSWWLLASAGGLAGLAAGTKFTGLAALVLLGVLVSSKLKAQSSKAILRGLVILASAFVVYLFGWYLHFALLTQPGPGDVWGVPTGSFITDTVELHKTMFGANYNLEASHPDESRWWTWPWMGTSIFYWSGGSAVIYFLGNPFVWWGGGLLFLLAFIFSRRDVWKTGWIPFVGLLIAMLPFVRIPRALFLYHYLTPLLFMILFGLMWLDWKIQSPKLKIQIVTTASIILIGFFVLFSPLTYGFEVSPVWLKSLFWLPDWR